MSMSRFLILLFTSLLLACSGGSNSNHSGAGAEPSPEALGLEVALESGVAKGREHPESTVWEWLGIPFAKPPIGDLRWKAPLAPESWEGVRDTVSFGSECPQTGRTDDTVFGDEDCLHLNVWRPRSDERDLPVYVWVHGGSNTSGANNWSSYQGDRVAQNSNMVVVSIQYRLGALGWLYSDSLHNGDPLDDSGNYGLLDIIESLKWVQGNIAAFGGDPDNVIITGESAGAINIMNLLVSELASDLFHKAIIQSGIPHNSTLAEGNAGANSLADKLFELAGGDSSADLADDEIASILRGASAAELVTLYGGPTAAYLDGTVIPLEGLALVETGEQINKVPIIVGTNKDEFKLYTNPLVSDAFSQLSEEVRDGLGRYASDLWRVLGADKFATGLTSAPDQPEVYVYRFNWGSPNDDGRSPLPGDFGATLGAHHAMEITFVLGNWEEWVDPQGTAILFTEENALGRENLSNAITTYFAAFARSGNPNGDNLATWEPFSTQGDFKAIVFDVDLLDSSAKMTVDTEVWTVDSVLAHLDENLVEPTRSAVLLLLSIIGWN